MHNKIIKYALVLLATASSIFAWNYTNAFGHTYCGTEYYEWTCANVNETFYTSAETLGTRNEATSVDNNANFNTDGINLMTASRGGTYRETFTYAYTNDGLVYIYTKYNNTIRKFKVDTLKQCPYTGLYDSYLSSNTCTTITYEQRKNMDLGEKMTDISFDNHIDKGSPSYYAICLGYQTEGTTYCISADVNPNNITREELNPGNITAPAILTNIRNELNYQYSPFTPGGGNGGGSNTGTQVNTGKICPMIQFQIDMYGNKYNTGLCYTNTIEYTGGSIQTVTPKDIFEIFTGYQQYINRYNLRNNNCHAPYTQEHCTQVMSENRRAIQIFNKIEKAGVESEKVYQYCHLQLHFTDEQKRTLGTCQIETETNQPQYATGTNQQNSNPNPLEGLTNALQNGTLDEPPVPNTGTVFDEILPDGVLSRKDVLMDYNFYSHFTMLYIKITKLFQARGEQDGIIPPYITSLLLLIILFKIYKK